MGIRDRSRFRELLLYGALLATTACSGGRSAAKSPHPLTPEAAKQLVVVASSVHVAVIQAMATKTTPVSEKDYKSWPLSLLGVLPPPKGAPRPPVLPRGPDGSPLFPIPGHPGLGTLFPPRAILDLRVHPKGANRANGEFRMWHDGFGGRVEFTAEWVHGAWEVTDFRIPAYHWGTRLEGKRWVRSGT